MGSSFEASFDVTFYASSSGAGVDEVALFDGRLDIATLSRDQLIAELERRGLETHGTKAALRQRFAEYLTRKLRWRLKKLTADSAARAAEIELEQRGSVYAAGLNAHGDNMVHPKFSPIEELRGAKVVQVSANEDFCLCVTETHEVHAFGDPSGPIFERLSRTSPTKAAKTAARAVAVAPDSNAFYSNRADTTFSIDKAREFGATLGASVPLDSSATPARAPAVPLGPSASRRLPPMLATVTGRSSSVGMAAFAESAGPTGLLPPPSPLHAAAMAMDATGTIPEPLGSTTGFGGRTGSAGFAPRGDASEALALGADDFDAGLATTTATETTASTGAARPYGADASISRRASGMVGTAAAPSAVGHRGSLAMAGIAAATPPRRESALDPLSRAVDGTHAGGRASIYAAIRRSSAVQPGGDLASGFLPSMSTLPTSGRSLMSDSSGEVKQQTLRSVMWRGTTGAEERIAGLTGAAAAIAKHSTAPPKPAAVATFAASPKGAASPGGAIGSTGTGGPVSPLASGKRLLAALSMKAMGRGEPPPGTAAAASASTAAAPTIKAGLPSVESAASRSAEPAAAGDEEEEGSEDVAFAGRPRVVGGLDGERIVGIRCGGGYAAAISDGGDLFLWGDGGLGHGSLARHPRLVRPHVPVGITALERFQVVDIALSPTFALVAATNAATAADGGAGDRGSVGRSSSIGAGRLGSSLGRLGLAPLSTTDKHRPPAQIFSWGHSDKGCLGMGPDPDDEHDDAGEEASSSSPTDDATGIASGGADATKFGSSSPGKEVSPRALVTAGGTEATPASSRVAAAVHAATTTIKRPERIGYFPSRGLSVAQIACSETHCAALITIPPLHDLTDYSRVEAYPVYTWGSGDAYRLGHGDTRDMYCPTPVQALKGMPVRQVCVSPTATYAIVQRKALMRSLLLAGFDLPETAASRPGTGAPGTAARRRRSVQFDDLVMVGGGDDGADTAPLQGADADEDDGVPADGRGWGSSTLITGKLSPTASRPGTGPRSRADSPSKGAASGSATSSKGKRPTTGGSGGGGLTAGDLRQLAAYHGYSVVSWGSGIHGQLGLRDATMVAPYPTIIPALEETHVDAHQLACSSSHCALIAGSELYVWGYNRFSSLGLGPTRDGDRVISSPVATQQFDRIVDGVGRGKPRSVACGRFFTVVACHAFEEGVLRGGADGRRLSLLEAELKNAAYTELSRKIATESAAEVERQRRLAALNDRQFAETPPCTLCAACPGFEPDRFSPMLCTYCAHLRTRHNMGPAPEAVKVAREESGAAVFMGAPNRFRVAAEVTKHGTFSTS